MKTVITSEIFDNNHPSQLQFFSFQHGAKKGISLKWANGFTSEDITDILVLSGLTSWAMAVLESEFRNYKSPKLSSR